MAKVIAPFKISGTLDDINFVVTADGENYARMKGKTVITTEQFKNNLILSVKIRIIRVPFLTLIQ